jgi:hypothetical protein
MISVKCIRGAGIKEAPKIQDEMISTEHLAVLRGTAFLDEAYYNRTGRTVRIPYQDIRDGQVVRAESPRLAEGNYLVRGVSIDIGPAGKITATLDLEGEYEAPE